MTDKQIVALAALFLEEAATHGAGTFADRPAYKALQAALRPIRHAAPPPDDPRRVEGFVPAALGGEGQAKLTSLDHLSNVAEVEFSQEGDVTEKQLFQRN